jgi:hypothetical protein
MNPYNQRGPLMLTNRKLEASWQLGRFIYKRTVELDMSLEDLTKELGLKRLAKTESLLRGRHYFPLELARLTAKALHMDGRELVYLILLQYFPFDAVNFVFEAKGDRASSAWIGDQLGNKDLAPTIEDFSGKKRKKKRKKGKVSNDWRI